MNDGHGAIYTTHKTSYRINGKPVEDSGTSNVADGDFASLVGLQRGGGVYPLAFRNDSTGVTTTEVSDFPWVKILLLGIFMTPVFGIGIPFLLFAAWLYTKKKKGNNLVGEAKAILRTIPDPSASGAA